MSNVGAIAFILPASKNWLGGQYYLLNVIHSYRKVRPADDVYVISSFEELPPMFPQLVMDLNIRIIKYPQVTRFKNFASIFRLLLLGRDNDFFFLCKDHGITRVFSPTIFLGFRPGLKVACWIPDFQHKHLPHMFSYVHYFLRDASHRLCIWASDRVIVSSDDVAKDFNRMYSQSARKCLIVPFVPAIEPVSVDAVEHTLQKFDIDRPFFLLPNQFWKHKNHFLVLDVLDRLWSEDWDGLVVVTGSPFEHRDPGYVHQLNERLTDLQSKGVVRSLGLVERSDVLALLQSTIALLNPSLFEGRSSIVEEAIAFGVPMLLSNLAVHREQADDLAEYFDVTEPAQLRDLILKYGSAAKRIEIRNMITEDHQSRAARFGDSLLEALMWDG